MTSDPLVPVGAPVIYQERTEGAAQRIHTSNLTSQVKGAAIGEVKAHSLAGFEPAFPPGFNVGVEPTVSPELPLESNQATDLSAESESILA